MLFNYKWRLVQCVIDILIICHTLQSEELLSFRQKLALISSIFFCQERNVRPRISMEQSVSPRPQEVAPQS
jgi:hypothetical protein